MCAPATAHASRRPACTLSLNSIISFWQAMGAGSLGSTAFLVVVITRIFDDCLTAARKSYRVASGSCGARQRRDPWSKPSRALSRCLPKGYAGSTWRAARWAAVHGVRPSNQIAEFCRRHRTVQRAARRLGSSQTRHQNQARSISQRPAERNAKFVGRWRQRAAIITSGRRSPRKQSHNLTEDDRTRTATPLFLALSRSSIGKCLSRRRTIAG